MNLNTGKLNYLAGSLVIILGCLTVLVASAEQPIIPTPAKAPQAAEEVLTNGTVIELKQLGLGESVILEKIKTSHCEFDVSLNGLKQLKQAGVSDVLITAMLTAKSPAKGKAEAAVASSGDVNDPLAAHEGGIWIYSEVGGKPKMTKLEPSVYSQAKTGMSFFAAFGQPIKTQGIIRSLHAETQLTERRPMFYFYFDKTDSGLSDNIRSGASSPNEFILSRFETNEKDNQRSLVISEINVYSSSQSGADSKSVRSFSFEKLAPGIYKVTPKEDLANGEYCFYYGGNAAPVGLWGGGAAGGKVFDFGLTGSPETEPVVNVSKKEESKTGKSKSPKN